MINDILDFSKNEAGKLQFDPVDFLLRDMLHSAISPLAARAHGKGLELACHVAPDVPDALRGDPGRIRQIVVNLVGNAIKFTEAGEIVVHVHTEVSLSQPDRPVLRLSVSDTGSGIPADRQAMIFDAFAQADGYITRKHGGTGLGLSISRQLAELMGGRLWVDSQVGRGSTFHCTVCMEPAGSIIENPSLATASDLVGLRTLVVDDNATSRLILEEMLQHWQAAPTVLDNAQAALAALRQASEAGTPFALAIIDRCMPGMDGLALVEALRQDPQAAGVKIVMLTSTGDQILHEARSSLGIGAYLSKPVSPSTLFDAIVTVLGVSRGTGAAVTPERGHGRPLRILLAEDNAVNQKLACCLLAKWGHAVTVVGDGVAAVQAAEREGFDVVLMDVQMPRLDGLQATVRIRQREKSTGRHVPIIALTAHATTQDRDLCLEAGMDEYLSKPIRREKLLEALNAIVPAGDSGRSENPVTSPPGSSGAADAVGHPFDLREALAIVGGDPALLKEIAGLFLGTGPTLLANIHNALSRGDSDLLIRAAHSLKGSVGNFAARKAVECAKELEAAARGGDLRAAQEAWPALKMEMALVLNALKEIVREALPCES